MRKLKLSILLTLLVTWSMGQDVLIQLHLAKDSIVIGDQVDMTLELSYSKQYNMAMPILSDTLVPGIEILYRSSIDTIQNKKNNDLITVKQTFTLTSFEAGLIYNLPIFEFLINKHGVIDTVSSNQLTLKVAYPPMDSTWVPNAIKPPIDYPTTLAEVLTYLGGALLTLAIIALIVFYIRRRRQNKPLFYATKAIEPAHIIAIRSLERLKKDKLWQQGKIKEYYTELSEIIRIYLENRYEVQAMEQTSEEIISSLVMGKQCDKELIDKLGEIFYISDLVKFAKYTPPADEHDVYYTRIYQFVEITKIKELGVNQATDQPDNIKEV